MNFKSFLVCSIVFMLPVSIVKAFDKEVMYSTEEYCLLKKAGEQTGYLKAYANKLGGEPTKAVCRSFNEFVAKAQPKDWDYRGGKPYPGSALRLSTLQIEKLKAARKE